MMPLTFDDLVFKPKWPGAYWRQALVHFDNDYGASVLHRPQGSYGYKGGLYELAVIWWPDEQADFSIVYDTGITDNVLDCLSESDVTQALAKIERLEPRQPHQRVN